MSKPMPILDSDGKYVYETNTRMLKRSNHPVYRARIELALGQGEWIGAPNAGHQLARFKRARNSAHQEDEFKKAVAFYLDAYGPDVVDTLVTQGGFTMDLEIQEDALNAVV